ncbi:MAG: GNAT family N-acetyltransferase [Alphaproteobacteria bacterium]|nr:GNAT family N-acetyltransferase [Alphaproteobacteria bacterium]
MKVVRLTDRHAPAIEERLLDAPPVNLFLLGYLDAIPIARATWYGVPREDGALAGLVMLVPGRLAVPWCPEPEAADALGRTLHGRHRPCMMVGPREACDALWAAWAPADTPVDRWHDQRLYVCDQAPAGEPLRGFRRAVVADLEQVVAQSAAMEWEDVGRRVLEADPGAYRAVVQRRIEAGQTWVLDRDGELHFQINVGTVTRWGVQVGGTYVPPAHRGQGLATAGMKELCRRLLGRHRMVTLHVNEANTPAVHVYERAGFRPHTAYRLVTLREDA